MLDLNRSLDLFVKADQTWCQWPVFQSRDRRLSTSELLSAWNFLNPQWEMCRPFSHQCYCSRYSLVWLWQTWREMIASDDPVDESIGKHNENKHTFLHITCNFTLTCYWGKLNIANSHLNTYHPVATAKWTQSKTNTDILSFYPHYKKDRAAPNQTKETEGQD